MKNLKILTFGILLVGMYLTSCKKDVDQQLQKSANQQLQQNALAEKSLTVYSQDKTLCTMLRLQAPRELLDKVDLSKINFTLANDQEPTLPEKVAPTLATDEGLSGFTKEALLLPSAAKPALPANAILVDLPDMPKVGNMVLSVVSKDEVVVGPPDVTVFYFRNDYHRIRVTNFHPRSIIVDFYNYFNGWHYSGFSYQLFQNQFAWYQHCTRTVGANVTHGNRFNYVVRFVRLCQ